MAQSRVIRGYLAELSAQLPAPIVAELADGLDQTHRRYLGHGLSTDAAATAAVAEFGEAQVVIAAFTAASPARRAARRLLVTGPGVGACWGTALIIDRAWTWPVPIDAPIVLGIALITAIGLLAAAAFGSRYRSVGRAGAAGCLGITALDATMLAVIMLAAPAVIWPVIVAVSASVARLTFATCNLRPVLATLLP
jgi:hypothetical protein